MSRSVTGGSRTLKLRMEPSTSSWRVFQFHHGDVSRPGRLGPRPRGGLGAILGRWYRRRDSNPHNTQFLRLRPLPVGPRRHECACREATRAVCAGGFEPPIPPTRTECSSQVEPCTETATMIDGSSSHRRQWTSRESHPNHLLARQTSPLGDKPVMSCVSRHVPPARCFFEIDGLSPIGTARRDRTCLLLLVMQAQSLDCQRRSFARERMPSRWITCESNAVRAPYQRVQGDQPVVIRRSWFVPPSRRH